MNEIYKIASWNINSIRVRQDNVLNWIDKQAPDLLLLQEIKCQDPQFPKEAFEEKGYHVYVHGQKSYNGVAILSKIPAKKIIKGLPGDETDEQARYLEIHLNDIVIACLYLPNGNPRPSEKYDYKLSWMKRLKKRASYFLEKEIPFCLAGDFNVIPDTKDVYNPQAWEEDALYTLKTRQYYREMCHLGLTDSYRALHPETVEYSFWDYQKGRWQRNEGIRIDHILLCPYLSDRLIDCQIDREPRGKEKASDHTPIWCTLHTKAVNLLEAS